MKAKRIRKVSKKFASIKLSSDKWSQVIIPVGVTDPASRPKSFFYTRSYSLWLLCLQDMLSTRALGSSQLNWAVEKPLTTFISMIPEDIY